ncbi:MAG TPA: hypothetical protein VFR68_01925 [Candidatus Dormibacteraeota bacterium]|nr:hypothetical protein [Candidatus Dormibacteraeota bacterium]
MGLFSAPGPAFRPARFRSPIRLHSELSLTPLARAIAGKIRKLAVAATNDARIVGVVLLLAAAALAFEMANSFRQ